jgi:hypothetical protein
MVGFNEHLTLKELSAFIEVWTFLDSYNLAVKGLCCGIYE